MNLHVARLAAALVMCAAMSWLIPDAYRRATNPERMWSSAFYSAVIDRFMIRTDTSSASEYSDEDGKTYTLRDFRLLLPFLYFADLEKQKQFPSTVAGTPVTPEAARQAMQSLQLRPRDWNRDQPPLHVLLEASPTGASLGLPPDVFRLEADGITFIRCADGSVNAEKSANFRDAMNAAGVAWPLRGLGGNPTPLKPFDEGYLLVDGKGAVFQLTMVRGEPACRATGLAVEGRVRAVVVDEHPRKEFIGAIVTDAAVYLVMYGNTLTRLPLEGFDASGSLAQVRSDPLHRTVATADVRDRINLPTRYVAVTPAYAPVRRFNLGLPAPMRERLAFLQDMGSALSPFAVRQFAPEEGRILLRVEPAASLPIATLGCVAATLLLLAGRRWQRQRVHPVEMLVTLAFGLPGLVGVALFGPVGVTPPPSSPPGGRQPSCS